MDKTLFLMQGIPGSGKSTVAAQLAGDTGHILSTDDYWYRRDGTYRFKVDRLGNAHRWNQQRCVSLMQAQAPVIIIDNTNIKRRAAMPYRVLADIYDYDVKVVRVDTDVETCIERQQNRSVDRRIPEDVIRRMASEMEDLDGE